MAKAATATLPQTVGASTELMERLNRGGAPRGVSTSRQDNIVPLVYVLQAQSPQVNKRGGDYIEGAEAGVIWLRGAPVGAEIIPGDRGINFQPCHFYKEWVEWMPDRGGYVGRHDNLEQGEDDIPACRDARASEGDQGFQEWTRNGNDLVLTRCHVGYVLLPEQSLVLPYIVSMTGSNHKVSRSWMGMMLRNRPPGGSGPADSWFGIYNLRTKFQKNTQGEWFGWDVKHVGNIETAEEFDRGEVLYESFKSGDRVAEQPVGDDGKARSDTSALS